MSLLQSIPGWIAISALCLILGCGSDQIPVGTYRYNPLEKLIHQFETYVESGERDSSLDLLPERINGLAETGVSQESIERLHHMSSALSKGRFRVKAQEFLAELRRLEASTETPD